MSGDPVRLLVDPATADALRADLQVAADAHLAGFDAAGGFAQLQASIGTETAAAPTVAGASAVSGAKIAAATAVVAAVAWLGLRSSDDATAPEGPAPVVAPAEPAPDRAAERSPAVVERDGEVPDDPITDDPIGDDPPVDAPTDELADADQAPKAQAPAAPQPAAAAAHRATPRPAPAPSVDSVLEEAKRVKEARGALDDDPALALRLTEALADDYPSGQLVEERRAIEIRALAALGRTDEARTRGEAFLRRYGRGPHAAAVRRAIDAPDP